MLYIGDLGRPASPALRTAMNHDDYTICRPKPLFLIILDSLSKDLLIFHLVTCEYSMGRSVQGWSVFGMPYWRLVAVNQLSIFSAFPSTTTYPDTILSL